MLFFLNLLLILFLPIIFIGTINRTKAIWAGRKGYPILQLLFDLGRLLKKDRVYSTSTSWLFGMSGIIFLSTTLIAATMAPIFPEFSLFSFRLDFVYFAYLLALGRVFLILGALDTGSAFEGMGASREASFSALIEPAFFVCIGTLSMTAESSTLREIISSGNNGSLAITTLCTLTLFILIQAENARVPVDDPNTHLELTMIHEVMILDHSGPDLAYIQYASALKMTVFSGLVAALINPYSLATAPLRAIGASLVTVMLLAISIGLIESLVARLRLKAIPFYLVVALGFSIAALVIGVNQ